MTSDGCRLLLMASGSSLSLEQVRQASRETPLGVPGSVLSRSPLSLASPALEHVISRQPDPFRSLSIPSDPLWSPLIPSEQVISRRRKTLMDMAEGMKSEIRHAFDGHEAEDELAERGTKILTEAMRHGPLAQSPDWFNDDENFASSVTQALGCKQGVVRGVTRLPMKAEHVSLQGWKLQLPGRALLFAGWLRSAPAVTSIDLRECNLTPTEVHSRALTIARYCRDTRDCTL